MKRIVTMQDLSCLGKCSLTVAHPVLSAMGCACSVLPTAVFSTHTAFPGPAIRDLSDFARPAMDQWQAIGAEFDGILTGYLANRQQAELALELRERFGKNAVIVHDPAMADNGRLYGGMGPDMGQEDSLQEGNGKPLQDSCLGNPVDRGAWRATVHGVSESDTTEVT